MEGNKELASIQRFLNRYLLKEDSLVTLKIMHELPVQRAFLRNFTLVERIALKLIEHEAPKFNLFNILNIGHLEAKVHTPFLASLLDPEGSHRQGRLFFTAFMSHLFKESYKDEAITNISVITEMSDYTNGRMDIVISYLDNKTPKAIVIENKIYHHDEKQQLTRYYNSLTQTKKLKDGQFHLIYLTPYRKKPGNESIGPDLYKKLTDSHALTIWGYYDDIAEVLESLVPLVKAPIVAQTLHQYIKTIQDL